MTSCLGSLKRPPFSWDLHTSWARGVTFHHKRPIKSRSVFTSRTPSVNETKQTIKSRPKYTPFDRFAQCDFFFSSSQCFVNCFQWIIYGQTEPIWSSFQSIVIYLRSTRFSGLSPSQSLLTKIFQENWINLD